MSIKLIDVIHFLRPNAEFVIRGEQIEWLDKKQSQPTNEEIEANWEACQAALTLAEQTKINAKIAAEAKLAALGLTSDDLKALGLG